MIDWHGIAPEVVLGITLLAVLLVDLFVAERQKWTLAGIAALGLLAAAVPVVTLAVSGGERSLFGGTYVVDDFALVLKGLFLAAGYVVLLLSVNTVDEGRYYRGEFWFLLLSSILGMLLISSARDLIVLFVAFELLSAPGYMLAAWKKKDLRSNEAGLKYFLLGVLSTAITLYGMSLVFGLAGSTKFSTIAPALARLADGPQGSVVILAVVLIFIGFAFKISAVPFHFWAPDTYEGAPTPVTAFLSVSAKAAGFVGLVQLTFVGLAGNGDIWRPMFWVLSVLTMTVGNLVALRQTNIVRLLAYSSIAQAGYILAPFAVVGTSSRSTREALSAAVAYLIVYAVMNLGAFAVVIAVARRTRTGEVDSYKGLYRVAPGLGVAMALFMGSLAGIPPLAGWYPKVLVFKAVVSAGTNAGYVLAVVVGLNAVVALFYYMGVVRRIFMDEADEIEPASEEPLRAPAPLSFALGLLSLLVVVAGILPGIFGHFAAAARLAG